jgi:hypothetical protein
MYGKSLLISISRSASRFEQKTNITKKKADKAEGLPAYFYPNDSFILLIMSTSRLMIFSIDVAASSQ